MPGWSICLGWGGGKETGKGPVGGGWRVVEDPPNPQGHKRMTAAGLSPGKAWNRFLSLSIPTFRTLQGPNCALSVSASNTIFGEFPSLQIKYLVRRVFNMESRFSFHHPGETSQASPPTLCLGEQVQTAVPGLGERVGLSYQFIEISKTLPLSAVRQV